MATIVAILWASPYTLVGLFLGGLILCTGGGVQLRGRAVEFYGGACRWLFRCLPNGRSIWALTLGHTILGQSAIALDMSRSHETVHVRQFERWGPLMGPAYLLSSLVLWLLGRNPYLENPFEKEAFKKEV